MSRFKNKSFSKDELRQKLNSEQFHCTQENGTERPFQNLYWDHKEDGIYVDVVSGEPLFSSLAKFDSGSGWPSFAAPLSPDLNLIEDSSFGMQRVEVRSSVANSHLGHVFDDGPLPTRKRYCINSASLRFIPTDDLKQEGYGEFLFAFAEKKSWEIATFAGGCFWGMEEIFGDQDGVVETEVGYTGGAMGEPTYEKVCAGKTGHAEGIQILFDPKRVSYSDLLILFFKMHDPTTLNQQGNDRGTQYRSAIFYQNDSQKKIAETIMKQVEASGGWKRPLVTEMVKASRFWRAEEEHQKYLRKHPGGYSCHYVRNFSFIE